MSRYERYESDDAHHAHGSAMSTAVIFLLAALGGATIGSVLLWAVHHFPKKREPDYREQLEAIAPPNRRAVDQPSGIVKLVPPYEEES